MHKNQYIIKATERALLITPEGLPGWEDLPTDQRTQVRRAHAACLMIAQAAYGRQDATVKAAAESIGLTPATMRRRYDAWRHSGGSLLALADGRVVAARRDRSRTQHPAFVAHWHSIYTRCQRNAGTARHLLLSQWRSRETPIPAYEDWPDWPSIPTGWSRANLTKLAPKLLDRVVIRQGIRAAHALLPQVLSTRVGLWPCSHVPFDDVHLDVKVIAADTIIDRPLQLGCNDLYTGKRLAWGQKIRRMDKATGKHIHLRDEDMRLILASWAYNIGYSPRGTVLIVENGTASINADMEHLLHTASNGLITVDRSGINGKVQALLGGWGGRGVGNPDHKAGLESWHNLQHNRLSYIPGATGHDRNEPEMLHGIVRAQEQLIKARAKLSPERAALTSNYLLTETELADKLADIVSEINHRTDHHLDDWAACGWDITEYRLDERGDWSPLDNLSPERAALVMGMARDHPGKLIRRRHLSPQEAWEREIQLPGNQLIRMPAWAICDILGRDLARPLTIKGSMIRIHDKTISESHLIYETRIITPEGYERELDPRLDYMGCINPYDPEHLFVTDPKGRCMGVALVVQRVNRTDHESLKRAYGRAAQRKAELLAEARTDNAQAEADIISTREHNQRVISGDPVTYDEIISMAAITPTPGQRSASTRRRNAITSSDIAAALAPVSAPSSYESDEDSMGDINISDLF